MKTQPLPPADTAEHAEMMARLALRMSSKWLSKPILRRRMLSALEESAPPERVAKILSDSLIAEKAIFHEGREIAREPDTPNRIEAAKTILRIQGIGGEAQEETPSIRLSLNVDPDRLAHLADKLADLNARLHRPDPAPILEAELANQPGDQPTPDAGLKK